MILWRSPRPLDLLSKQTKSPWNLDPSFTNFLNTYKMARGGTISENEFLRLLSVASVPIYVLDDDRHIRYANPAFFSWTDLAASDIIGQRCDYHSRTPLEKIAGTTAGLCPPPEALVGHRIRAVVACRKSNGKIARRWGDFVPLTDDPVECPGVVAILESADTADLEDRAPDDPQTTPAEMHDLLRKFQNSAQQRFSPGRLIGNSPTIRRARAQIELAMLNRSPVLIVGPTGSGHEYVARTIHYGERGRAPGQLLPLECGLVDAEILETTITAFMRRAREIGNEGEPTLLLLATEDLPRDAQKVLFEKIVTRLSPLRVISTSRYPLVGQAMPDDFMEDLGYALSTLTIELPPLSQRIEDLPLLAQMLLEELNAEGGRQLGGFSSDALDQLALYAWPRNVDELAETIREIYGRADGPLVDVTDLPENIHLTVQAMVRPARAHEKIALDDFLADIERELIQRALQTSKRNKAGAARLLGISRARLLRRINQLKLDT